MGEVSDDIKEAFGRLVKAHRHNAMLSQEDLAERSKLDRTYISGVERGTRNPSLLAITRISSGLEITASQLLEGLERSPSKAK